MIIADLHQIEGRTYPARRRTPPPTRTAGRLPGCTAPRSAAYGSDAGFAAEDRLAPRRRRASCFRSQRTPVHPDRFAWASPLRSWLVRTRFQLRLEFGQGLLRRGRSSAGATH